MTKPPADPFADAKRALRPVRIEARRLARLAAPTAGEGLAAQFLRNIPLPAGAAVAGYWPLGDEIDVRPLMARLHEGGHPVGLPVVAGRGAALEFRRWRPGDALEAGGHGTWHPPVGAPAIEPDVVLVPMLAFDAAGWRLGYGGGYYDRTLEGLRRRRHVLAVGVAYAGQRIGSVPHDGHDQRLDWVVTETDAARIGTDE